MASTTMMKTDKAFDDFLKGISFADFDVAYTDGAARVGDVDLDTDLVTDDTARVVFAGPIKVVEPVESPTSVDAPMRLAARNVRAKRTGRASANAQRRRDRRDRRRNQGQRERENEKRKLKQADCLQRRDDCFKAEHALRGFLCTIITTTAREHGVGVDEAIDLLPPDVRRVIERSVVAMQRYRGFAGQKNICEEINRFPAWAAEGN